MVFSDFKDSIKTCHSDNYIIKDFFSCYTCLSYLWETLEFLEFFNLSKTLMSLISEFSSKNWEVFKIKGESKNRSHNKR
jgi:hypothetical protein